MTTSTAPVTTSSLQDLGSCFGLSMSGGQGFFSPGQIMSFGFSCVMFMGFGLSSMFVFSMQDAR